jgi:hypothetical protein
VDTAVLVVVAGWEVVVAPVVVVVWGGDVLSVDAREVPLPVLPAQEATSASASTEPARRKEVLSPPTMSSNTIWATTSCGGSGRSVFHNDDFVLARSPNRDLQVVVHQLDRRGSVDIGHIEGIEDLAAEIETRFLEQVLSETTVQLRILEVLDGSEQLRVAFTDIGIWSFRAYRPGPDGPRRHGARSD